MRPSRRAFLGASAGLVGSSLLSGCSSSLPVASVAIIGGGIAGLTCAYRLKQLGIVATIYEGGSRVGGRMRTDRTTFAGTHAELGGDVIDSGHASILGLCNELGLQLADGPMGTPVYDFAGAQLTTTQVADGMAPITAGLASARAQLTDPTKPVTAAAPNGATELDTLSLAAWLDGLGVAGPVRTLFELQQTIRYGLDPDQLGFLTVLFGTTSDARYRIAEGADALTGTLASKLDPVQVQLDRRLVALAPLSDGRLRCTFDTGGSALDLAAELVVLALPFTTLRTCTLAIDLPPLQRQAIMELGYGAASTLLCGFATPYWAPLDGFTQTDVGYQESVPMGTILANVTGGRNAAAIATSTADVESSTFLAGLDLVIPGAIAASSGQASFFGWPAAPLAGGSVAAYLPLQATTFGGVEAMPVGTNVFFAGEHTAGATRGTMEGGASSGAAAAMQVAAALGVSASVRGA